MLRTSPPLSDLTISLHIYSSDTATNRASGLFRRVPPFLRVAWRGRCRRRADAKRHMLGIARASWRRMSAVVEEVPDFVVPRSATVPVDDFDRPRLRVCLDHPSRSL